MNKKESKEKRESNEESKENLKAKSDDSGEEKNGDDDSQKNGPKKKGKAFWTLNMLKSYEVQYVNGVTAVFRCVCF